MTHGEATLKENLLNTKGDVIVEQGTTGIVTAYLPEQDTFAVMFPDNQWITFKETEEDFLKRCKYQAGKYEFDLLSLKKFREDLTKEGPRNIPVYIENVEQFTQIFGEIDKSFVPNTDNMTIDEKIEHVKSLFEFEEDKTLMNQMIEELKNQNKDE